LLQRNEETQAVMQYLATPRIYQLKGEEIEVQDQLAQQLDDAIAGDLVTANKEIEELKRQYDAEALLEQTEERKVRMQALQTEWNQKRANLATYNDATFIGAIVLKDKLGTTTDLISNAELVDLPGLNDREAKVKQALIGGAYHLVQKRGLARQVVSNTLVTMEKARQLEYFRKADLPNNEYVILVEVHYYRNRPTSSTKLHKDTSGETLFVNLSFTNKKRILGPEYIVNPASNAIYDQFVKQKLPEVFVDDLDAVRKNLKGERIIEATVLEENGVVAFVDEAIHHKTPTAGPRTGSAEGLKTALAYVYGDEYDDAAAAYKGYKSARRLSPWTFASYFKNPTAKAHSNDWWQLLEKLATLQRKDELNRAQLKKWLPDSKYFTDRAEEILEQAATDFTSVSFGHLGGFGPIEKGERITVPVRQRGEKPLERRMSMVDLSQYKATASEGGKRSFFRTWVRAVPREKFG
jgi:hypothetical protein